MMQPCPLPSRDVARFGTLTIEPSPARPLGPPDAARPSQDDATPREERPEDTPSRRPKKPRAEA